MRIIGAMAAVAVVAVAGVGLATTTAEAEPKQACELAAEWVEVNRSSLPTTLVELSSHSMPYRQAIVAALPHEVQVELWREHLTTSLESPTTFTEPQRALIEGVIADLDFYMDPANKAAVDSLRTRVLESFTVNEARPIFATLGPEEVMTTGVSATGLAGGCECEYGDNYCFNSWCNKGGCDAGGRCGTLWLDACDGTCGGPRPTD